MGKQLFWLVILYCLVSLKLMDLREVIVCVCVYVSCVVSKPPRQHYESLMHHGSLTKQKLETFPLNC